MNIEIWSDYACPFCYVAKQNFAHALSEFDGKDGIHISHKTFRLDPSASDTPTYTMQEKLQKNYGKSHNEALAMMRYINQAGEQAGVVMNVENVKNTNTLNAHRLHRFAEEKGVGDKMNERLYFAYFTESQNLADTQVLANLAQEIGLNRDEVLAVLSSDAYRDDCLNDEKQARNQGIHAVPLFIFDGKYAVSGAQPKEAFLQALKQSYDEYQSALFNGASCGIDGCS